MAGHAVSAGDGVRAFRYGEGDTAAFDDVRDRIALYRGLAPEPVPPGVECRLALAGGRAIARASVCVAPALEGVEGATGLIGHFEALEPDGARAVLAGARAALASRGVRRVLAPVNGSTWRRYRLALPGDEAVAEPPPFLGEPVNPSTYPAWIEAAGFVVAARYESRVDEAPHEPAADAAELAARIARAGVRVRMLDPARFDVEARVLHELSLAAFAHNPYYAPIAWEEFHEQYARLRAIARPELVLIAENLSGCPVAFQFAYLDPLAAAAGVPPRAIVKTVATLPEVRGIGLAGHLLDRLREHAAALGARSVIHALMHVANFSMRMSARHRTRVFRRYALYEWRP